ncbi:PaaI family thioesterase [Rhodobacteraceae bacterium CCMM004]|nr:PaaI family thioesterase [Rhodobacteraceae bacterium CCMM004]
MMATLGARLERVAPGRVVITAPVLETSLQQHGTAHAALTFAIGDSAAGYAALSVMDPDVEVVTAEIKINLLAPARGPLLTAEGRVVRAGRRLVVVAATVSDPTGDVALLQGTMVPVSRPPR